MVDLIVTDTSRNPVRALRSYDLDLAFGSGENDFKLSGVDPVLAAGCLVYMDGTEYGGVVDKIHSDGSVEGRTWHGMLAAKILTPDPGADYLTASGPANAMLGVLFRRVGLDSLFIADTAPSPGVDGYRFDRYVDAYAGIRGMLAAGGLKLHLEWRDGLLHASARPVTASGGVIDSDLIDFQGVRDWRPVNHLIGLGEGELRARAVCHWYADVNGGVSRTQTMFGLDEVAATYDYSNAKSDELAEETRKKLVELQSQGSMDVKLRDMDTRYDIGDLVTGRDNVLGQTITATVSKKIVKSDGGTLSVSYEIGQPSKTQTGLSGRSESSPGGGSYTAGKGISLSAGVISADVDSDDLARVARTASDAEARASGYSAQIGKARQDAAQALDTASAKIGTVQATAPVTVTRTDDNVTIGVASASATTPGLLDARDKAKLDGIDDGANRYRLPAATVRRLGGVRPDGQTITIDDAGVITSHATIDPAVNPVWPVGYLVSNTTGRDPGLDFGGTWVERPSLEGYKYERVK
jgi:hypothetical protein